MHLQVFVGGMVGLQPNNECGCDDIIATVINHGHLTLKIANVAFESFSFLHLERNEMVVVLLEFLPRGVLVEKSIADLLEAPERSRGSE